MSILIGITFSEWKKLLAENNFRVSPKYLPRMFSITLRSIMNSREEKKEINEFAKKIQETSIEQAPVFILGHWRSGTTLLQNYFSMDKQFAFPNLFEAYNPHSFLHLEPVVAEKIANAPAQKRPMDNVQVSFNSPAEDEFALGILSRCSPLLAWVFPNRQDFYDRYLTMQDVSDEELERWENAFQLFVRKLTLKNKKQLILKSPPHTGRVRLILKMYPDAKFIHLYRNPFDVFKSTQKLFQSTIPGFYLQKPKTDVSDIILKNYARMYESFFDEKKLIKDENLIELSYEDLAKDPITQIRLIYEHLQFPGFDEFLPSLKEYVASIANYKRNNYNSLPKDLKEKILDKWSRSFSEWGYSTV